MKLNLAVLDPLGLPLSTTVVSGEQADDPLYVPEIRKVQRTLGQSGMTYVGDCKLAAASGASQGGHDRPHHPPSGQKALHR